jgi:peptidyl-prolyl cis-trans isomerase SurA
MKRRVFIFATVVIFFAIACPATDVVDRIVATVNGHIILQSDWEDAVRYEALVDGRPLDQISPEERKAALDHLIDQELLREQMQNSNFPHATDQEVQTRVQEIRRQNPGTEDERVWSDVLQQYGLTEEELKQRVSLQFDLMRLVDVRLRPNVNVDAQSIERYYNQELLPQIRQSGEKEVPLKDVTPRIRELLTQQKVNELLVAWLQNLRSGSEIRKEQVVWHDQLR